jgi:hypothetical protein
MTRLLLAAIAVSVCACGRGAIPTRTADAAVIDRYPLSAATEAERQLFSLVNAERERAGLPGLAWNGNVAVVAREHSEAASDGDADGPVPVRFAVRTNSGTVRVCIVG